MTDCLFCKIIAGDVPAAIVAENEHTIVFRDINPQAPTHLLVVSRVHHETIADLAEAEPQIAAALLRDARAAAADEGHGDAFRLVFNNGAAAQQTVFHVHGHIIAGRDLTWPPG